MLLRLIISICLYYFLFLVPQHFHQLKNVRLRIGFMRPCLFLTAFEPAGKHFLSVCFFHPFADMHELGLNGARGQLRHGSQQVLPVRVQTLLVGNKLKLSCCPFLILFQKLEY